MKKRVALAVLGMAFAGVASAPSSAQAYCHCGWHHWHHVHWVAPEIDYVTSWWEHPYYYWAPYTVVDHYATAYYPYTYVGDAVLVHRVTEVGPIHYAPVPVVP